MGWVVARGTPVEYAISNWEPRPQTAKIGAGNPPYMRDDFHTASGPFSDLADEDVLEHACDDPHAFEELLRRYQEPFLRKARSVVRNHEDAQDVVQDTFLKIYKHAHRFERQENGSFKAWGYKILMNTAITRYQKLKRIREKTATLEPEHYESLPDTKSEQFEQQERTEYVQSVLARMPETLSRALSLHVLEGRPQQEIADLEGVSVGAVKTRVHRAKKEFDRISAQLMA